MDEIGSIGLKQSKPPSIPWLPNGLAFSPYLQKKTAKEEKILNNVPRKPFVARLTKYIVETYQACNPQFEFWDGLRPKIYLISPSIGVLNDGHDNANSDLILSVNLELVNSANQRSYIVKEHLGHGTFGQVAKCWVAENECYCAVKIIKNMPAYFQQAMFEVSILSMLNMDYDPDDTHHIVRFFDHFEYKNHLCICFELLYVNLYQVISTNNHKGLSLEVVQSISKQILLALGLLKGVGIIHCDLKPENILLYPRSPPEVKIIDFGSACMENRTVYSYIQSRYYRSPEVLLGYQYTTAIDMWSFGCIVAELFLGLPLFPGQSEFDLLQRMIVILGGQPPDCMLKKAKNTGKFFMSKHDPINAENGDASSSSGCDFLPLSYKEYVGRGKEPKIGKNYFHNKNLEQIVKGYPYRKNLSEEEITKECNLRAAMLDFLKGIVEFDPAKRWTPFQASRHPFITGESFLGSYVPPMDHPCRVMERKKRDIQEQEKREMEEREKEERERDRWKSPRCTPGGAYDTRHGFYPHHLENGHALRPLQYSPSYCYQVLPRSFGYYDPIFFVGSSSYASPPLEERVGPFRRRQEGQSRSFQSQACCPSHWHKQVNNGMLYMLENGRQKVHGRSPSIWQPSPSDAMEMKQFSQRIARTFDPKPGTTFSDPGDWDPNYSDEFLLQEDNSHVNKLAIELRKSMLMAPLNHIRRPSHASGASSSSFIQRQNVVSSAQAGMGSLPSALEHGRPNPSLSQFLPYQRYGHQMPPTWHAGWNNVRAQFPHSLPPHDPFNNTMPWGYGRSNPITRRSDYWSNSGQL